MPPQPFFFFAAGGCDLGGVASSAFFFFAASAGDSDGVASSAFCFFAASGCDSDGVSRAAFFFFAANGCDSERVATGGGSVCGCVMAVDLSAALFAAFFSFLSLWLEGVRLPLVVMVVLVVVVVTRVVEQT